MQGRHRLLEHLILLEAVKRCGKEDALALADLHPS